MHEPSTHAHASLGAEPTILLVAEGERLAPALAERLAQHGAQVELATPAAVVTTAFVGAPDVVVLAGQAAIDGGEEILARLAEQPATSALPVILIADEGTVTGRLEAFRHGVVAVIARSASADEMARRIAEIARDLPERAGETAGPLEPASLENVVALFAQSLRSGVLSVTGKPGGPSAQVVLRPERPLTDAIAELVERLKPLLAHGDHALSYEFHESPPSRISSIELGDEEEQPRRSLEGVRLLVIQANAARADLLAQELRAAGATVVVADGSGAGLELAHDLAPDVIVMDGAGVDSWALDALRAIRRDARLHTASLLVLEADQLWQDPRRPSVALLSAKIEALLAPDRDLETRARASASIDVRLDVVGPIRLLRALVRTELGLGVSIVHPRLHAHIDLADGLVVGATARLPTSDRAMAEGPAALASFLGLSGGRVHIEHAATPKAANIMAPIDAALAAATKEAPLVAPSLPPAPPSSGTHARPPTSAGPSTVPSSLGGGELPALVERLEGLVQHLRTSVPAPAPSSAPKPVAIAAPDASGFTDEQTSTYSPQVMELLRRRVRRSSANLRAVEPRGASAPSGSEPTTGVQPVKLGPPASEARLPAGPGGSAEALGASGKAPPRSKTLVFGAVTAPTGAVPTKIGIPSPAARPAPLAPATPAARAAPLAPRSPAGRSAPLAPATPSAGAAAAAPGVRTGPAVHASPAAPAPTALAPAAPAPPPTAERPALTSPVGAAPAARMRRSATLVGIPSPVAAGRPKDDARAPAPAEDGASRRAAIAAALAAPGPPVTSVVPELHELAGSDTAVAAVPLELDDAEPSPRGGEPATAVDLALPEELVELAEPADEPLAAFAPRAAPPPAFVAPAAPPPPAAPMPLAAPAPAMPMSPAMPMAPPVVQPAVLTPATSTAARRPAWHYAAIAALALTAALGAVGVFFALGSRTSTSAPAAVTTAAVDAPAAPNPPVAVVVAPSAAVPGGLAPSAPPPPTTVAAVAPAPPPAAATEPPPSATPTAEPPPTAAPVAGLAPRLPLGPTDPIEGLESDFDLARLGITPSEPPASRGALNRRVSRLLADAYRHRSRSNFARAEEAYRTILSMDPDNPRATAGLALVNGDRGDVLPALLFAQRLTRLRPEYANNFVLLGDRYLAAGDPAAARRAFEHALELEPDHRGARERISALP